MLLLFLFAFSATRTSALLETEVDEKVRQISKTLRCAVCQSESVWESNAELATQMRDIIRERVMAGESEEEILDYFVSRYGDFILLKPQARGLNQLLWFGPFLLLVFFAFFIYWKMRTLTKQTQAVKQEELSPLNTEARQRIEEVLKSYEGGRS